ncbi:hypothetical protein PQX77_021706 [Marasmius sp. AFHP31]|nr:hypothetical protein PQX77_021706 [Marasmius sp. AFHP31]
MAMHRPWDPPMASFCGEIEVAKATNPYDVLRYTNSAFQTQCEFAEGIGAGRTNAVAKLKAAAGEIYSDFHWVHPNFFASRQNDKARSENAEARELLGFNSCDTSYALLPPLLYLLFRPEDPNGLFRSEELMKLAKVLLFGSQSIKPTPGKTKKTMGQLWDIKSSTPGLIAFTAVFARFLFSPDKDFTKAGKVIKYAADFDKYKKNLIISSNNAHIQKTFALWNAYLFGTKAVPEGSDDSDNDEMLRAIDDMGSDSADDTVPIVSASRTPQFTPTPVASAIGTPQLTPTPTASTVVSRQPTPTPTRPSTAAVNVDTELLTVESNGVQAVESNEVQAVDPDTAPSQDEAPPRAKRGSRTTAPKATKGKSGGGGQASGTAAGSGAGNGKGRAKGRGGRGKARVVDVPTDEEQPAPPTNNRRLTRQGASQNVITVSCGDEEESE